MTPSPLNDARADPGGLSGPTSSRGPAVAPRPLRPQDYLAMPLREILHAAPHGKLGRLPEVVRWRVSEAAHAASEGRCVFCGAELTVTATTPRLVVQAHEGGAAVPENLAACCAACDGAFGPLTARDWLHPSSGARATFALHAPRTLRTYVEARLGGAVLSTPACSAESAEATAGADPRAFVVVALETTSTIAAAVSAGMPALTTLTHCGVPRSLVHDVMRQLPAAVERCGGACVYCGELLTASSADVSMLIMPSERGKVVPGNLVASCRACVGRRGRQSLPQFLNTSVERLTMFARHAPAVARETVRGCYPRLERLLLDPGAATARTASGAGPRPEVTGSAACVRRRVEPLQDPAISQGGPGPICEAVGEAARATGTNAAGSSATGTNAAATPDVGKRRYEPFWRTLAEESRAEEALAVGTEHGVVAQLERTLRPYAHRPVYRLPVDVRFRLRQAVVTACGGVCVYCNRPVTRGASIDHVLPLSAGGRTEFHNLVASCASCNQEKGSLPLAAFLAADEHRLPIFRRQVPLGVRALHPGLIEQLEAVVEQAGRRTQGGAMALPTATNPCLVDLRG